MHKSSLVALSFSICWQNRDCNDCNDAPQTFSWKNVENEYFMKLKSTDSLAQQTDVNQSERFLFKVPEIGYKVRF